MSKRCPFGVISPSKLSQYRTLLARRGKDGLNPARTFFGDERRIQGLSLAGWLANAHPIKLKIGGMYMASDNDMKAHNQTYGNVTKLLTWGTVGSFLIGLLVIIIIAS
jgi:hypothetical protein